MSEIIGCDPQLTPSSDRQEIQVTGSNVSGFGDNERFVEDSSFIQSYLEQNAEEISLNGIRVLYIAIKTNLKKDKVTGEDASPVAIELYNNNIRMKTDSNMLPSATNLDTAYGEVGWIDTMIYFMSKLDFSRKTKTRNLTNDMLYNLDWIPKPGDIIIVDLPPYYPTLEVIDVDDDAFHYISTRPNWVLTLQSYTKKLIDFNYIKNKYRNVYDIIETMINPLNENNMSEDGVYKGNNLNNTNDYLDSDERNMNSSNKVAENTFRTIFGD